MPLSRSSLVVAGMLILTPPQARAQVVWSGSVGEAGFSVSHGSRTEVVEFFRRADPAGAFDPHAFERIMPVRWYARYSSNEGGGEPLWAVADHCPAIGESLDRLRSLGSISWAIGEVLPVDGPIAPTVKDGPEYRVWTEVHPSLGDSLTMKMQGYSARLSEPLEASLASLQHCWSEQPPHPSSLPQF